jgi:hypothetical protein
MFGQNNIFYHNTLRRAVASFGTVFNDIYMKRFNADGTEKERFKVPLSYSSKQKFIQKIKPQNGQIKMILPRIGFEMTSMTYDPIRKTNTLQKRYNYQSDTSFSYRHERVPYDIEFSLYIATKNIDDGLQIIEQIIPFFTPEFTITFETIDGIDEKTDMPIVLNGVTTEDNYEGTMEEDRMIIHTLTFTAKVFFAGPVKRSGIIRTAIVDINELSDKYTTAAGTTSGLLEKITVGLTDGVTSGIGLDTGATAPYVITIQNYQVDGITQ